MVGGADAVGIALEPKLRPEKASFMPPRAPPPPALCTPLADNTSRDCAACGCGAG